MNILALDIATKTGWAVYDGAITSGVLDLSGMPDHGQRGMFFHGWISDLIVEHKIEFLICESTLSYGHAAYVLIGLAFTAQTVAYAHDIKRKTVAPTTLKKFATGSGRAGKQEMMEAVRKMGFDPVDDNEADAIALITYALQMAGQQ